MTRPLLFPRVSDQATGFTGFIMNVMTTSMLLLTSTYFAYSQEVIITEIKRVADKIEVHYDIIDEKPEHSYSMQLYSSRDNFIRPLENVEGDVGIDIPVGGNKKITWNAMEELGADFDGKLALELKGSLYVPFITVEGLEEGMIFKRGKPHDLTWTGGRGDNILNIELYQGDNLVKTFEERPNVGNTTFIIPTDVKPGKNYRFMISDTRNRDEVVYTSTFVIKRKVPLGLKIGLGFLVGGVVGYLVGTGSTESEPKIGPPPLPPR